MIIEIVIIEILAVVMFILGFIVGTHVNTKPKTKPLSGKELSAEEKRKTEILNREVRNMFSYNGMPQEEIDV